MPAHRHTLGWTLLIVLLTAWPAAAQQEEITNRPYIEAANLPTGFQVYREKQWTMARTRVINPTSRVQRPMTAASIETRPQTEFARRVWLPPHSQRLVSTPIYPFEMERASSSDKIGIGLDVRLIEGGGSDQRAWPSHPALLPVRDDWLPTIHFGESDDQPQRDLVRALRMSASLNDVVKSTNAETIPSQPVGWDAVGVITVSRASPRLNSAQRDALRRWLVQGGRLWIMIDQVDLDWPEQVLGEAWNVVASDRVGLHEFTLEWAEGSHQVKSRAGVEMVRLFPPDEMEVIHRVNGYPASMRRTVGEGMLLVTTLGTEAWVDPEDGSANEALEELDDFFALERDSASDNAAIAEAFRPFVTDQIGYSILDRGSVAIVLAVFVMVLLVSGVLLAWRGRLEAIGIVGAGSAVTAAVVLYIVGTTHHGELPMSIAEVQLAYPNDDYPYAETQNMAGVFIPPGGGGDEGIRGTRGVMWPSRMGRAGDPFRLIWTDRDRWEIPQASLGAGTVHTFSGEHVQSINTPMHATLRFTEDGELAGQVQNGPYTNWEDGVIATAQGRMAVDFGQDADDEHADDERTGNSASSESAQSATPFALLPDRLDEQQFIKGSTVSSTQQQRQRVYRALANTRGFSAKPFLLGWADGGVTGLDVGGDPTRRNASLVVVPVHIEPPEPGSRITVPAALMSIDTVRDVPDEYRTTSFYNSAAEEWNYPLRFGVTGLVRYELPEVAHNLDVTAATITADLRAPGWQYELLVMRGGRVEVVDQGVGSLGMLNVKLEGEDVPEMTEDGAVRVGLRMSLPEGTNQENVQDWALRWMGVSLTGTVRESTSRE